MSPYPAYLDWARRHAQLTKPRLMLLGGMWVASSRKPSGEKALGVGCNPQVAFFNMFAQVAGVKLMTEWQ